MLKRCFNFTFLLILHFTFAQVPSGYSLIAYEGFDYPNNTNIANQSGGIGWAGNWEAGFYGNSTMIVNSSGLSYTGLNVSGNKLQWGGAGQYQPHSVRRAINNPNSGIVYLRFISDFNSSSGGTDRLDLNLGGITQASFGGNNSQQKMSILAGGLIINSTYSVYDLSLVVIQIDYTNNTTKMWVKPTLSTFDYSNPGTPNAIYNNSIAFDQISLTFRSGGQIDEIAVFKNKTFLTSQGSVTDINTPHLTKYGGLVTSEINGSLDLYGKISITAPDAPIIGTAIATSTQTSVSFAAPLSDGDSPIINYTAIASPGGNIGTVSQAGSGTITVTGLTNGTAYTFTVTATNSVGTSAASAASNSVTPATVPDAPTIGTATAGNGQASVPFTAPASDGGSAITSYTATSNPGNITGTISQAGSGTITVTGLTNGTAYTFTVTATNSVGTSAASAASNSVTLALAIGDPYQGGKIFWLDATGQHGLIAAPDDQSAKGWSAAQLCNDLVLGGYSDWYLPSKDELNKLYLNKGAVGGFASAYDSAYYWSSTEKNFSFTWVQNFHDGYQTPNYNYNTSRVRAVRAF